MTVLVLAAMSLPLRGLLGIDDWPTAIALLSVSIFALGRQVPFTDKGRIAGSWIATGASLAGLIAGWLLTGT